MSDRQRYGSEAVQGAALGIAKKLAAKGNMYYCKGTLQTAAIHYQNAANTLKMSLESGTHSETTAECYVLAAQCYERLSAICALSALGSTAPTSPENIRTAKAILDKVTVSA